MLYYQFNGYEGFKLCFGLEQRNNGTMVRKNKILLDHLKHRPLLKYCRENNDYTLLNIHNMADLQEKIQGAVKASGKEDESLPYKIELIGETYWSAKYRTDEHKGLCEDMDKASIWYVNIKRDRPFKMKSGKFMRSVMAETKIGQIISPVVLNWLSGDVFTQKWHTYMYGQTSDVTLHVDSNFKNIYTRDKCKGNFKSCMADMNRDDFYKYSVKAQAAYITDAEGSILARAILFTDVSDSDGGKWRLLERQYSSDDNTIFKHLLIEKLIHGKHIDGYKIVGASCNDASAFVKIDGTSLHDKKFEIECDLEEDGTLSYQDSFKWYDYTNRKAYNYPHDNWSHELDTTDETLSYEEECNEEWDEYHQYYCEETRTCYRNGREISVDVNNLDDFEWICSRNEYHHYSNITVCEECEEAMLIEDTKHSDLTGGQYCCQTCREEAEKKFKSKNWHYSEYDDEWFENEYDITNINIYNDQTLLYEKKTISINTLQDLIMDEKIWFFDDEPFNAVNPTTRFPYNYKHQNNPSHEYTTSEASV